MLIVDGRRRQHDAVRPAVYGIERPDGRRMPSVVEFPLGSGVDIGPAAILLINLQSQLKPGGEVRPRRARAGHCQRTAARRLVDF